MSSRLNATVCMVALFVAGGICGAVVMHHFTPPPLSQPLTLDRVDEIAQKISEKMKIRLSLTPEQSSNAAPLIHVASQGIEDAHRTCLDQIAHSISQLHQALSPMLTDSQRAILKQMEAERADLLFQKYKYRAAVTN